MKLVFFLGVGCLIAVLLALPFLLRSSSLEKNARRAGKRGKQKDAARTYGRKTHGKISVRDREDMLDNVRNLARAEPKKVAGMLREWINEDETKPE